jgi:hypothetical protein
MSSGEVRVEPGDMEAKASEINAPWPPVPTNSIPPCTLRLAGLAVAQVNASAATMTAYIKSGEAEAVRLSESFIAAANTYRAVDEASRSALERGGEASIPPIPVMPSLSPPVPIPAELPAGPPSPAPEFLDVKTAAMQISQPDQAASLDQFEIAWRDYAAQLEQRADSFQMDQVYWEGSAAEAAGDALKQHQIWLRDIAQSCRTLADQAGEIADAHRKARAEHPPLDQVQAVENRINNSTDVVDRMSATHEYAALQAESERVLGEYALRAYSKPVKPQRPPPPGAPQMTPVSRNGDPRKAHDSLPNEPVSDKAVSGVQHVEPPVAEDAAMPQAMGQPAAQRHSAASPAGGGAPSGGGASSGGSAPQGGGAPSGGGMPGGLPGGIPGAPTTAAPKSPTDPRLRAAAASGGGGSGAASGGGLPPRPLSPAVGAETVAPPPDTRAAQVAAPAATTTGAVAGGMAGGVAPMAHGAGLNQGKEKRRSPDLAPDEDLYTEGRPWTEAVIGNRRRRDVQDGKDAT